MKHVLVAFALLTTGVANAQGFVDIPPFVGDEQETFESFPLGKTQTLRILGDRATLRNVTGGAHVRVDSMWTSSYCTTYPADGVRLAGIDWTGTQMEIVFDEPVNRFGAYFSSPNHADGRIAFYGVDDSYHSVRTIWENGCAWRWNGWETTGTPIKRVRIRTDENAGQEMLLDLVQADFLPSCAPKTTYCTAKPTSICGPAYLTATGWPSARLAAGFSLSAHPVPGGNAGMVLYSNAGRAAIPFDGGYLCMPPSSLVRAQRKTNWGTGCTGTYWVDMNTYTQTKGGTKSPWLLVPGTQVVAQYWGRGSVQTGSVLSDAVEYTICAD